MAQRSAPGSAQLVWLVCVVCALFLAVGALTYALDANPDNALVEFVLDGANAVDLGVFTAGERHQGVHGKNADDQERPVQLGARRVVWLVVGRILDRMIRP